MSCSPPVGWSLSPSLKLLHEDRTKSTLGMLGAVWSGVCYKIDCSVSVWKNTRKNDPSCALAVATMRMIGTAPTGFGGLNRGGPCMSSSLFLQVSVIMEVCRSAVVDCCICSTRA